MQLEWPLMQDNVAHSDKLALMEFLAAEHMPRLTNGAQVRAFEEEFSDWQGCKYSVMVNSGASANLITLKALAILYGLRQVYVPCITWVSDIAAVIQSGHDAKFVDIHPETLGMDVSSTKPQSGYVYFVTHCLGFAAIQNWHSDMILIEDCCEALGATVARSQKVGNLGLMSNFSFYYGHHMTTIEGGMVCTNDERCYEMLRMLRSHGLVREMDNEQYKRAAAEAAPDLDPEFIFMHPAYNMRPTEINGVLGRSQLKRINDQNARRTANLVNFLNQVDGSKFRTKYQLHGSSNFAIPIVLQEPDAELMARVLQILRELKVECRRGTAGGGNQLRQPYARELWGKDFHKQFPQAEHVHQFGLYVGNYPSLERSKIDALCEALNRA